MKRTEILRVLSLQLFAEGGEGAAEGGQAAEQSAPQQDSPQEDPQESSQEQLRPEEQTDWREYALWAKQAEQARWFFPRLDMNVESQNPVFRRLLKSGLDVADAYQAVHRQEILSDAMRYAIRAVEQKLMDKLLASGGRPLENGISAQAPAVSKTDVSKLSKAERAEIRKRAAMGEKIRF